MRVVSLREFGMLGLDEYEFVFTLDNQTKDYRERRWCVIGDRRVFNKKDIALNPDCIRFYNGCGESFVLDGVESVEMRGYNKSCNDFFFDVVCHIGSLERQSFTFLAKKCNEKIA